MRNRFKYALLAAALAAPVAMAAENVVVQIKASVPTTDFYVRPAAGTDLSSVQTLNWNAAKGRLDSWQGTLDMKNTAGGIQAVLDSPSRLYSGSNYLPLYVLINDRLIPESARCRIAQHDDVKAGRRYVMEIRHDGSREVAGSYTGAISIIFQPEAPPFELIEGLPPLRFGAGDDCDFP